MGAAHYVKMIEANLWADRQLVRCVGKLTDQQLNHDFGYSMGTTLMQVAHLFGVQYWWFHFLSSGEYHFFTEEDCSSLDKLRPKIAEAQAMMRAYASRLTDAELERRVKPEFWPDKTEPWAVWEAIHQVINHSTDHRAQALGFIHRLGGPTFAQDYLFYERPEVGD